jgi:hypothetical protein
MKKILSFTLLVAVMLSLSACGKKEKTNDSDVAISKKQEKIQKDLMSWLKSGEAVECQIEMEGSAVTMIAKDEKVRIEGIAFASFEDVKEADIENSDGVSLTVGDWMYMWNNKSKKGMKFNIKEMEKLDEEVEGDEEQDYDTWEDQVGGWEDDGVEYDCKKTKLADDLFVEPKGIEFTDLGEMMKGFTDLGKNLEKQIENGEDFDMNSLKDLLPEGMEIPEME